MRGSTAPSRGRSECMCASFPLSSSRWASSSSCCRVAASAAACVRARSSCVCVARCASFTASSRVCCLAKSVSIWVFVETVTWHSAATVSSRSSPALRHGRLTMAIIRCCINSSWYLCPPFPAAPVSPDSAPPAPYEPTPRSLSASWPGRKSGAPARRRRRLCHLSPPPHAGVARAITTPPASALRAPFRAAASSSRSPAASN
mmetsp:Transcript_29919/g.68657  ORF Transcript_29919/g.68657 Transcript_29919/m.68657 type:complete len:203 (+) Transcript_29919:427-1035(+)